MVFTCKKVNKVTVFHLFYSWLLRTFFNTQLKYYTVETLEKEVKKRKELIKNFKKLIKENLTEEEKEIYKKGFDAIEDWETNTYIMEQEFNR